MKPRNSLRGDRELGTRQQEQKTSTTGYDWREKTLKYRKCNCSNDGRRSLAGPDPFLVWLARPSHLNARGAEWEGRSSGSND